MIVEKFTKDYNSKIRVISAKVFSNFIEIF